VAGLPPDGADLVTQPPGQRVGVLGAGALGLVTALRLAQRGYSVTIIEREGLPGGLASGFEIEPGMWLEKFYHHLFRSDRNATALIGELGLGDQLRWSAPATVTLRDGILHRLDSPATLLRFRPLPVADRLRMGAVIAYLRALPTPDRFEGQTAASWIRRAMGERAYEVVWGPLLRGKFGAAADEIAMPWFWARVHDRTTALGYLRGGFQHLYEALAARLRELGADVRLGAEVRLIERTDGKIAVDVASQSGDVRLPFDIVVSTLATRLT
jgi:protoporphyrinogen oxidase